jgi:large subunit ribosomal protein L17
MRHQKKKITLDRKSNSRRALLVNLAESLILHEKIKSTKGKCKALRPFVEKLISKAKKQTLAGRRELIKILYTDNAVKKLMEDVGPRYKERQGGYTRIVDLNRRAGDGAEEAVIELV